MVRALTLLILLAAVAAGCGLSSGEEPPSDVNVTVTRDFGRTALGRKDLGTAPAGQTVMNVLKGNFDVTTGTGDRVQQIGDVASAREGGRRFDWFYYVNGIAADKDAAA